MSVLLGDGAVVYPGAKLAPTARAVIGARSKIYDNVFIAAEVEVGEECSIHWGTAIIGGGSFVMRRGASLGYMSLVVTSTQTALGRMSSVAPRDMWDAKVAPVVIDEEAFVGPHCTLMPGCYVGEGAVVGAGTYLVGTVEPWTIVHPKQELVVKHRKRLRGF